MKFTANTAQLAKACQNVQRAVASKNSSIPAIEGILLDARGNRLYLTGSDLEVGIKTAIEAQIDEEGAIILNDQLLCDILRRLPGEFVEIEADDRFLTEIRCGETKFSLIGIDAQEYPELPSVTGGEPVLVEQEILRDMVRQTIFATATTESKAIYTGKNSASSSRPRHSLRWLSSQGRRMSQSVSASAGATSFLKLTVTVWYPACWTVNFSITGRASPPSII